MGHQHELKLRSQFVNP